MRAGWGLWVLMACHAPPSTPASREPAAPTPTTRAAPARERRIVTDTVIEKLDPILFLPGSSVLEASSMPILDAIARTIQDNPNMKLLGVRTYAADALAQFRARVSSERADAVIAQLVARGVARTRLVPDPALAPPVGANPRAGAEIMILKYDE